MSIAKRLRVASAFADSVSLLTLFTGLLVLAGWWVGIPEITSVVPGWPKMVALTALGFALAGFSLWLQAGHPEHPSLSDTARAALARACAIFVALIGAVGLVSRSLGWNVRLDEFVIEPLPVGALSAAGSMSLATALSLLALGVALFVVRSSRNSASHQLFAIPALLIGWLGLSRYVFGGEPLIPYASMAIHTCVLIMLVSAGVLALSPDVGIAGLLTSGRMGGLSARRLLPAAMLAPIAGGAIALHAARQQWLGIEAAVSLLALVIVIVFAALVWINSIALERSQRKLGEREERTRRIVEGALDAVVTIDTAGIITSWNAQAQATFGWTREEVVGQSLAGSIIPERYREAHRQGLRRYLQTGEQRVLNRRIELSALRKDGTEFPIELSITPIVEGDRTAFSAFVRDITERQEATRALRASELRLRTLAESLPHLVWTCEPDGWCDYLSRQWVEYTGRPEAEQRGYGWADSLHPEDRERVQAEWAAATARGDYFDIEFRIRRSDGVYRWFKTRAVPLRDSSGTIVKWFGSNTDIDDFKLGEKRLRLQLEHLNLLDRTTRAIGERQDLRTIFEVVLRSLEDRLPVDFACVCVRNATASTLSVARVGPASEQLAQQLGFAESASIAIDGNGLSRCMRGQLVYEPDVEGHAFALPARLAAGGLRALVLAPLTVESSTFGLMLVARRGQQSFSSADCEFLRQLSAHVALAAHQAKLYSELQRAYDDLRETRQGIVRQERLRALGQMASGIAHDINNALSPAALYTESLLDRDSTLSNEAREHLAIVQRAIEDVSHTVSRMREFYRPLEPQLALVPVDLNRVIGHVLALTRAQWQNMPQEHGAVIQVQTALAPDLPPILGSEGDIRDALTNLILNAVDAMPTGGTLGLRSWTEPLVGRGEAKTSVVVEVIDTGVGMDAETCGRCLEPFYTTKGERGSGLGLAMVYGMVQRHGAEIRIDSEPGHGTAARLAFTSIAASSSAVTSGAVAQERTRRLRVLAIDDDPLILESLKVTLESDGHEVTVADGGQAGIDRFRDVAGDSGKRFEVILTDLGMPHVDGRAVAAAIKAVSPWTPIVLLTGWGHRLMDDHDIPFGVDRVLSKPPRLAQLRGVLAELSARTQQTA